MAEEVECNSNNISFLEKCNVKAEFVFETIVSANQIDLKDNVWDDRIKEYKIASTVDDMKIELPSSEACKIVINDNVKIENEINPHDMKIEFDNKLFYSTEYKITSIVDDMKIELPSSEACNVMINENVKIGNEINPDNIKIECDNKLFFCDCCNEHYGDYCTRCGMLAHILNGITLSITDGRAIKGIPNNIVEIRESSGRVGIFALKVIPEGVKIGPFNGLSTSECPRRLKGGKFTVPEDKSKWLHWMQYINPARNIFQQNLIPFQREDNLYYHSNRKILIGEELLVYFGEEYEDSVNKDYEMDFIAPAEDDVKDVFACTPCCLGFSSRGYLAKHKSSCPNETNGKSSFDELRQCPICNIYVHEKEYLECHMPYCCETNLRKCIPLALDNQTVEVNRRKTQLQLYKCSQCKYKTTYKSVLRIHLNKHFEVKMHRCEICSRQFKTKGSLKLHVKYMHVDIPKDQRRYMKATTKARSSKVYHYSQGETKQCPKCKFQTKYKYCLEAHVKTKHLKEFSYMCEICDYKTNEKSKLKNHIKSKHLKQFSYECEKCDYKTNRKQNLETHIKSIHLKEFSYKCEICDYKTNEKSKFQNHIKSKHLKQFRYECETCNYKTNQKSDLEKHVKSKHLKQFNYECERCDYKANQKSRFARHVKSIHLKQFSYECDICVYQTNHKSYFETHVKSKHLKQFSYKCEICDYKINEKSKLKNHIKTKHLKQFSYECQICVYKTNEKSNLGKHIKSKHLKEFSYECEKCDYKTNQKSHLETHVKSKHLKEFRYNCEICVYRTNEKSNLGKHVKSIHLKQFIYECEACDYKTNQKQRFAVHVNSKHLKQFTYECEICDYKTNNKSRFDGHIKKHLK